MNEYLGYWTEIFYRRNFDIRLALEFSLFITNNYDWKIIFSRHLITSFIQIKRHSHVSLRAVHSNQFFYDSIRRLFHLESIKSLFAHVAKPQSQVSGNNRRTSGQENLGFENVYTKIDALRARHDRDYVHGDRASRKRFAEAYATLATRYPNILTLPQYTRDEDCPIIIPDIRFW